MFSPTGDDEMCNFYMMYWVNDDHLLDVPSCQSAGPPYYYFSENQVGDVCMKTREIQFRF